MARQSEKVFGVRYSFERWSKPVEAEVEDTELGNVVRAKGNYGYADKLFIASIANSGSILLMDSEDGCSPSREMLERIRDAIEHHLEHHC